MVRRRGKEDHVRARKLRSRVMQKRKEDALETKGREFRSGEEVMEAEAARQGRKKKKKASSLPRTKELTVEKEEGERERTKGKAHAGEGDGPVIARTSSNIERENKRKKMSPKIKVDAKGKGNEKKKGSGRREPKGMRKSERLQREIKRLQRIKSELEKEKYQHGLIQKDFERIKHIRTTIEEDLDRTRRKQLAIIKARSKTWDDMSSEIRKAKEEIRHRKLREAWEKEIATQRKREEEREKEVKRQKQKEEKEVKKNAVINTSLEVVAGAAQTAGNVSPKLSHRVKLLDKWMKHRPTWSEDEEEKNKKREMEITENINEVRKRTFRSSAELLELLLKNRPSSQELELRGILKDEEKSERKKKKREERLERELSNKKLEKEIELTIRDKYYFATEDWHRAEKVAMEMLRHENKQYRDNSSTVLTDGEEFRLVKYCEIVFHPNGRLGGGSFGDVFVAVVPGIPGRVAVKILKGRSAKCEQAFNREIEALKRTGMSDYTVKLRGWSCDVHYCIITELCEGGSMESLLHQKGYKLSIEQAVTVGRKIVEAMDYLHSLNPPILHRDISPGNIFLHPDINGKVCIGDFGIAVMKTEKRNSLKLSKNGNPRYRAPEVSKGEPYSRKADVYSFGNLFYELLTGLKPFSELESGQITAQIISGETPEFPKDSGVPKKLKKMVKVCWAMEPSNRPSFGELLKALSAFSMS